jgi:hypothetical protein
MGSTFVDIADHGFWMRDSSLELWLRMLAMHIEDPPQRGLENEIRDQWLVASRGICTGCVPHLLSTYAANPAGQKVVRNAIHSLMSALREGPEYLSKDTLNVLKFEWGRDVERDSLLELGQAFLDLLDGKITSGAESTAFMPTVRVR